jgi:MoaA/NifB/PqqE/SkfB family radical SAM enzyme
MNNLSKTFCPLPWIHLATRPNGDVRVCCTANASGAGLIDKKEEGLVKQDGAAMNLQHHTIEEVWNSQQMKNTRLQMLRGEIPESCKKCFVEESNGIDSKRIWETKVWKERLDIESIVKQTKDDGSLPVNIPYFDLRLGNLCQLKCIMCSPHDSSSWIKDWKQQYPKYKTIELKQDQAWDINFDYTWYKKGSFLETMRNQAESIKELYFAGGEPLLIPEHYNILEFMVESNNAKNCILRYNSNGLVISDKLLALWEKFKHVKFNFSVDAYGDKNDYIRYPSKWADVEKNLYLLDNSSENVTVNLACAVQALNVLYLDELAQWKLDANFKKINLAPYGAGIIGLHLVYLPSYLNIRVLPNHVKTLAADKITKFIDTIKTDEFVTNSYGKQRWQGIVNYMMEEDWSNKLKSMTQYLETCDLTRGTNFRKTFLELDQI